VLEKKWSSEADVVEFTVQRWMSVDEEDGDVVREVAAEVPAADKPPGIQLHRLQILFILCGL